MSVTFDLWVIFLLRLFYTRAPMYRCKGKLNWSRSQVVKASVCKTDIHGCKSHRDLIAKNYFSAMLILFI